MIGSILGEIGKFVNHFDDDIADRCSHRYTVMILSAFIFVIGSKQYFGDPIVCWTPASFSGSHNSYANTICWTHGTYPVGAEQLYHTVDRTRVLPYYQWVPFILLFQAIFFCLPNILWHTFSRQTGIDVHVLVENAIKADRVDATSRDSLIEQIAKSIHTSLITKYEYDPLFKRFNIRKRLPIGKRHGNYLYIIYIAIKLLYLLNIFAQLFLMNYFYGFEYHTYGIEFLRKFFRGDDYSRMDIAFPRVTYCDFKIRNMADNIHQHSVQCALPINLLNEKFFIILWFWLILVAVLTICSFFAWIFMLFPVKRKSFFEKYLKAEGVFGEGKKSRYEFDAFVDEYCHLDGAFVLTLMRRNTNFNIISKVISLLWKERETYVNNEKERKESRKFGSNSGEYESSAENALLSSKDV